MDAYRKTLAEHRRPLRTDGTDYATRVATGEPLAGMLSGRLPLVWTHAQTVYDSPEKKRVEEGEMIGKLMHRSMAEAAASVQSELLIVTPFLIPSEGGSKRFDKPRKRGVGVRILTNYLSPRSTHDGPGRRGVAKIGRALTQTRGRSETSEIPLIAATEQPR